MRAVPVRRRTFFLASTFTNFVRFAVPGRVLSRGRNRPLRNMGRGEPSLYLRPVSTGPLIIPDSHPPSHSRNPRFHHMDINEIRKIHPEEIPLLDDFLYEAIFIPEGTTRLQGP